MQYRATSGLTYLPTSKCVMTLTKLNTVTSIEELFQCFILFLFSLLQTIPCIANAYFQPDQPTFGMWQGGAGVVCVNNHFCSFLFLSLVYIW